MYIVITASSYLSALSKIITQYLIFFVSFLAYKCIYGNAFIITSGLIGADNRFMVIPGRIAEAYVLNATRYKTG